MKVKIAGYIKESIVDGPGIRYVVFAQGCGHDCPQCHNPNTHDFNGGYEVEVKDLLEDIHKRKYIDGVTLSGGDPFYQSREFAYIAKELKESNINVMAYTGFLYEDILRSSNMKCLLDNIDILMDGPFKVEEKTLKMPFRGSKNQRMINVKESLVKKQIVLLDEK